MTSVVIKIPYYVPLYLDWRATDWSGASRTVWPDLAIFHHFGNFYAFGHIFIVVNGLKVKNNIGKFQRGGWGQKGQTTTSFKHFKGSLTVFTNESGGIIDDLIVTKTDAGFLYVVSNAGCRQKDVPHMIETVDKFKRYKNNNDDDDGHSLSLSTVNKVILFIQGVATLV